MYKILIYTVFFNEIEYAGLLFNFNILCMLFTLFKMQFILYSHLNMIFYTAYNTLYIFILYNNNAFFILKIMLTKTISTFQASILQLYLNLL